MAIKLMQLALVLSTAGFAGFFLLDYWKHRGKLSKQAMWKFLLIGLVFDFFDTLGIGCFAPTTSVFKLGGLVEDSKIPGTLNVGHCIPIVTEAFIFLTVIEVDLVTLVAMIAAAVAGAVWGVGIVSKLNLKKIRIGMGFALLMVGIILLAGLMNWMPSGGEAVGLTGVKLFLAVSINFVLGALMMIGVGQYAPCMALTYSLGMSPKVAFPIMMGSCAFLMPAASIRFIRTQSYDKKAALGLTLGGIPGVFIAAFIITSLPLTLLKWLVFSVLIYTAGTMIHSGLKTETLGQDSMKEMA